MDACLRKEAGAGQISREFSKFLLAQAVTQFVPHICAAMRRRPPEAFSLDLSPPTSTYIWHIQPPHTTATCSRHIQPPHATATYNRHIQHSLPHTVPMWFVATGEALSLSEQHIVDCAWDHDVNGCWGGWGDGAMDMIVEAGGAVLENDYPYLGANSYCRGGGGNRGGADAPAAAAKFSGYVDIEPYDEKVGWYRAVRREGGLVSSRTTRRWVGIEPYDEK
eukprot:42364-Chlamydomonas_euryale.AAC.1